MHYRRDVERKTLKGRRWQFSLWAFFLVFLVIAMPLGFLASELAKARHQAAAVREITDHGGSVTYEFQRADAHRKSVEQAPGNSWLREWFGRNFRTSVISVELLRRPVADGELACLVDLTEIEELFLKGDVITTAGCQELANLQSLRVLYVEGATAADESAMVYLARLGDLESLVLTHCRLNEGGLIHLAHLSKLRHLSLQGTQLGNCDMSWLSKLTKPETLDLMETGVNNQTLPYLAHLSGLRKLNLSGYRIADDGLQHLAELNRLEYLWLAQTNVSDQGVHHLARLSNLRLVNLTQPRLAMTVCGR